MVLWLVFVYGVVVGGVLGWLWWLGYFDYLVWME